MYEEEDREKKEIDILTVDHLVSRLSEQEQETILLWSQGYTLREIAAKLEHKYPDRSQKKLTARTVCTRVKSTIRKLQEMAQSQEEQ